MIQNRYLIIDASLDISVYESDLLQALIWYFYDKTLDSNQYYIYDQLLNKKIFLKYSLEN